MKATEKQKTAILNLEAYLRTGDKTKHSKQVSSEIEKITRKEASVKIERLIKEVKSFDNERNLDALAIGTYDHAF